MKTSTQLNVGAWVWLLVGLTYLFWVGSETRGLICMATAAIISAINMRGAR